MPSTIPQHLGPWRFDELDDLPDDGRRYEVVDGSLVVSPPPTQWHQRLGAGLLQQLARQCPDDWWVAYEFPLQMGTDGRVPDLAVVRAGASVGRGEPPYPVGPDQVGLVVEIVSPSSRKTDRFAKPGEYAEAGIPLFWRVETDPDLLVVAQRLAGDAYERAAVVVGVGSAPAPWGPVVIDLEELARTSS